MNIPSYLSPCIITGDSIQPEMLLSTADRLYISELTVGFKVLHSLDNNLDKNLVLRTGEERWGVVLHLPPY